MKRDDDWEDSESPKKPKKRIFLKCRICKKKYKRKDHLLNHLMTLHNTTDIEDPKCQKRVRRFCNFYPDLFDKEGNPFKLFQIEKKQKGKIIRGSSPVDKAKDIKRSIVRKPIDSLNIRQRLEKDSKVTDCHLCGIRFEFQHFLERHYVIAHNVTPLYTCKVCPQPFFIRNSFTKHCIYHNIGMKKEKKEKDRKREKKERALKERDLESTKHIIPKATRTSPRKKSSKNNGIDGLTTKETKIDLRKKEFKYLRGTRRVEDDELTTSSRKDDKPKEDDILPLKSPKKRRNMFENPQEKVRKQSSKRRLKRIETPSTNKTSQNSQEFSLPTYEMSPPKTSAKSTKKRLQNSKTAKKVGKMKICNEACQERKLQTKEESKTSCNFLKNFCSFRYESHSMT
ncbi:unnamed protein product [Moneuplotes crassus]|uniref:C2H2-type domain-containing protein n=1 Tax=Euplotes crassus TaxID=5936 RepID=A0AAD1UFV3_EUPCR|nr:unnamed protein product [Moneuplotes crassus]